MPTMPTTGTTDMRARPAWPWPVLLAPVLVLGLYVLTYAWWRQSNLDGLSLMLDDEDAVDVWLYRVYRPAVAADAAITGLGVAWLGEVSPVPPRVRFDIHRPGP